MSTYTCLEDDQKTELRKIYTKCIKQDVRCNNTLGRCRTADLSFFFLFCNPRSLKAAKPKPNPAAKAAAKAAAKGKAAAKAAAKAADDGDEDGAKPAEAKAKASSKKRPTTSKGSATKKAKTAK